MPNVYREVGRRIADLRREHAWTQERLAESARVGASYVARIETGQRKPTLETLERLAAALGVPLARLFDTRAIRRTVKPGEVLASGVRDALRGLERADVRLLASVARRFCRHSGRR